MRRGQRTLRPNNEEDRHTCFWTLESWSVSLCVFCALVRLSDWSESSLKWPAACRVREGTFNTARPLNRASTLWVRSTSVYIPNTDSCSSFLLSLYLFFKLRLILCVLLFSERQLRYVRYMLSQFRLSVVCLSSVTLVRPTETGRILGNFFTIR